MKTNRMRLSQLIRCSLIRVFIFAFVISVVGVWVVQDVVVRKNTQYLLTSNRNQLRKALVATFDREMLDRAWEASKLLPNDLEYVDKKMLDVIAEKVGTDEICICDKNAIIVKSTVPEYIGINFREHEQTLPFCCLLNDKREFAQNFGPIAYDPNRYRKFVGVSLDQGGLLQLGFNEDRYLPIPDLSAHRTLPTLMVGGILMLIFFVVFAVVYVFFRKHIIAPIHHANAALARIAGGNLNERVLAGGSTEMDALANDINITVDRLKGYIDEAEHRTDAELAMARSIQTNVLPSNFPPYPNLAKRIDIFARMITAKEVGGDFYDFYFVAKDKLALIIADVSGKGIPAALFMMRAKTTIQGLLKSGREITEAIRLANDRLSESNDANMFATAWIGIVDINSGELEYVNAGHNPPILKRAGEEVEYLRVKCGPPLAATGGVVYTKHSTKINDGDGIVLYTDGVTEAVNQNLELYGEERLKFAIKGLLGVKDASAMIGGIVDSVRSFASGAEQSDDITLLAFKLNKVV